MEPGSILVPLRLRHYCPWSLVVLAVATVQRWVFFAAFPIDLRREVVLYAGLAVCLCKPGFAMTRPPNTLSLPGLCPAVGWAFIFSPFVATTWPFLSDRGRTFGYVGAGIAVDLSLRGHLYCFRALVAYGGATSIGAFVVSWEQFYRQWAAVVR